MAHTPKHGGYDVLKNSKNGSKDHTVRNDCKSGPDVPGEKIHFD